MKNWKSILLLLLVFFAGIAIGVVGTRAVVRRIVQQAIENPERFQIFIERDLSRRLWLDENQRVQLHQILSDTRGQLKDLRQQYHPQTVLIFSNADEQIVSMLTPEQKTRYEKLKESNRPLWRALRSSP